MAGANCRQNAVNGERREREMIGEECLGYGDLSHEAFADDRKSWRWVAEVGNLI